MFKRSLSPDWLLAVLMLLIALIKTVDFNFNKEADSYTIAAAIGHNPAGLNDSLPHYQYKRMADSIEQQQSEQKYFSETPGTSLNALSLGYSITDRDEDNPGKKYFLRLAGYRLKPYTLFSIEDHQWLMKSAVWDTTGGKYRPGHIEIKPVSIRFAPDPVNKEAAGNVLIPLSKGRFTVLKISAWIILIALFLYGIYALLMIPAGVLIRIAKGKSFSKTNYRRLFLTGWSLILFALLALVLSLVMHLVFAGRLPQEIDYPLFENLLQYRGMILAGLIVLLLARAFQSGYKLQSENDSTV